MNAKKLKSIAFDLDTKALQEHYTKGDWHNAYNDINSFLYKQNLYTLKVQFMILQLNLAMRNLAFWSKKCLMNFNGFLNV